MTLQVLAPVRVVAITDRRLMGDTLEAFADAIERALKGCPPGSVMVMVREKDLDGGRLLELINAARRLVRVIVNDRVDIALAAGAIAVHLPEDGLPVADVRAQFVGLIGVSVHTAEDATRMAATADLVQLGPIWETPTKPGRPALGTTALAAPHGRAKLVAVGGIDSPARARQAAQAGADAVAVIRAAWTGDSLVPYVTAVDEGLALRGA